MVRNNKKIETTSIEVSMQSAIDPVIEGRLSFRKAADKYYIKASLLESRVRNLEAKVTMKTLKFGLLSQIYISSGIFM